jgi:hypothetical protein
MFNKYVDKFKNFLDNSEDIGYYFTILIFFIVLVAVVYVFVIYDDDNKKKTETFAETEQVPMVRKQPKVNLYNPMYTSPDVRSPGSFFYTQPPGDVEAQNYAGSGQGTNGEFFPIQGRAAGVFMKNASDDNIALPSINTGLIGGFPNYNGKDETTAWIGFNNFGYPFNVKPNMTSNSYLLQGANKRVADPGRKADGLDCPNGWPVVEKGENDVCTISNDAIKMCEGDIENCGEAGQRFLKYKTEPQWKKVMAQVKKTMSF